MVRGRIRIAAASAAVVAAGLLTAGILAAAPAGAAVVCSAEPDCYALVGPPSAVAGASRAFAITVTNGNSVDTLGSVQVTAPVGFVVTGGSGATVSVISQRVVQFENLGLHPGGSASLTVVATAPCTGAGPTWTVQPGEASLFGTNGDNDGDAAADFVASNPAATFTGNSCSLTFQHGPVVTEPGSPIPSVVGSPATTSPVTVQVLDGNGNPSSWNASISMAAEQSSSPVTLSGTTSVATSGGVASFTNLSINLTGSGFQLVATSPGITQATSAYFEIENDVQGCSGGPCTGSATTTTTTGTVTTSSATSGQFLGVGLGGVTFACGGSYKPLSDPLTFDVLNSSGGTVNGQFTVTLSLSKKLVQSSGHPGASTFEVCFGSDVPFTALPGTSSTTTIGGVTIYTGLLPDCNNAETNAPCVLSRNKTNAGVEVVTFLGTGDSFGKM